MGLVHRLGNWSLRLLPDGARMMAVNHTVAYTQVLELRRLDAFAVFQSRRSRVALPPTVADSARVR